MVIMTAERIKELRKKEGLTQSELAKKLYATRAAVNAWEMGLSVPSAQYLAALAQYFHVSADYLLGLEGSCTLDLTGLTEADVQLVHSLVMHLREKNDIE